MDEGGGCRSLLVTLPLWFPGHPILASGLLKYCFSGVFFLYFLLAMAWCTGKLHPLGLN